MHSIANGKILPYPTPSINLRLIMKLLSIMLLAASLQVSATGLGQIRLAEKKAPLEKVLKSIKNQSGYDLVYDISMLNQQAKPVDIIAKNISVEQALQLIFEKQDLTYEIVSKIIVVKEKPVVVELNQVIESLPPPFIVTGKVLNEEGQPLIGATVKLKGGQLITKTDVNGIFTISLPNSKGVLVFSYVGYTDQEIPVSNKSQINITLKEIVSSLNDVVIVGYGSVKRRDLTGSVASIKSEDIEKSVDLSLNGAVQGRLSGVQVVSTDGAPGAASSLSVRGGSSISASNEPLYVIDGFPQFGGSNLNINPGDIANIEVLKDASATAIYGSRGANGVVIITTKKGETGKFTINYDNYISSQQIVKKLDVLNATQYAYSQHLLLSSPSGSGTDQLYANWATYKDSTSINWQDLVYKKAILQNHNLSFAVGTKDLKLSGSIAYTGQDGIAVGTDFNRITGRVNAIATINKFITSGTSIYLSRSNTNGPSLNGETGIAYAILQARPIVPNANLADLLDQSLIGDLGTNNVNNPIKELTLPKLNYADFVANFNTYLQIAIAKGLTLKLSASGKYQQNANNQFYPSTSAPGRTLNGVAKISTNNITDWLNENTLTYNKSFNKNHVLNVVAGFSAQNNVTNSATEGASNFSIQSLGYNNIGLGAGYIPPTSNYINQGLESLLGRVNYTLMDKYLFTASVRSDGSSKFQEQKWSTFPSAAFAWKVSEEKFMSSVKFISNLKIRTSWGMTGNQSIAPYSTYTKYQAYNPIANEQLMVGVAPSQLGNTKLKWETTIQSDLGIDLGLFKDRLSITADVYYKKSRDLLLNSPISLYSGYTSVYRNVGDIEVKGFELSLNSANLVGKLKWNSSFNIAFNRSKVLSLNDNQSFFATGILGRRVVGQYLVKVGDPLGQMYGYQYAGQFRTQEELINGAQIAGASVLGSKRYVDVSGANGVPDGKIDQNDMTALGNGNPLFFGGLNNEFRYKSFELSFLFTYSYGNKVLNSLKSVLTRPQSYRSGLASIMDSWTPDNINAALPKWGTTNTEYDINSSYQVEDGSYIKLKTLLIGYTVPAALTKRASIKNLRLYFSATNLLTFTNYSGYDPEVSYFNSIVTPGADMGAYPRAKVFTFGINLGL
ncbi:MAG: TonB-dependent receptor [Bacteroidetes bacterium]|nr:TonB-dependent receptor [Bacteroidota bacterium]